MPPKSRGRESDDGLNEPNEPNGFQGGGAFKRVYRWYSQRIRTPNVLFQGDDDRRLPGH